MKPLNMLSFSFKKFKESLCCSNIFFPFIHLFSSLTGSGKTIKVAAEETILQALAREGIDIEMSCEQGVCGTCMCDVIEGEPDHRDVYFTDEEKASNEQVLVCCSRSKSARLVLDI